MTDSDLHANTSQQEDDVDDFTTIIGMSHQLSPESSRIFSMKCVCVLLISFILLSPDARSFKYKSDLKFYT